MVERLEGTQLTGHGRIVCICGVVLAQCRCIEGHEHAVRTITECTHKRVAVGDHGKKARHIIKDSASDIDTYTNDGLAFAIGVCVCEAELNRDPNRYYSVCHPQGTVLYSIMYTEHGVVVMKVY